LGGLFLWEDRGEKNTRVVKYIILKNGAMKRRNTTDWRMSMMKARKMLSDWDENILSEMYQVVMLCTTTQRMNWKKLR
jgi:hypothetical protein